MGTSPESGLVAELMEAVSCEVLSALRVDREVGETPAPVAACVLPLLRVAEKSISGGPWY
jgi:hypothetical protein